MRKFATALYAATLLAGSLALAQTTPTDAAPAKSPQVRCAEETSGPERTLYLSNAVQQADANEVVAALRNLLDPCDKIYLVQSQDAIMVRAGSENMALAQKLLNDLDRAKKTYRLTYTVTEMDGTKKIGSQRFAMVLTAGQRTTLTQNSHVPVATGTNTFNGQPQTNYTWIDVGMNFDATLDEIGNGARLHSKVSQSSFVDDRSPDGSLNNPVRRDLTLEGASMLAPGKPVTLGSMDVPGSTRHLDIEVVMELIP